MTNNTGQDGNSLKMTSQRLTIKGYTVYHHVTPRDLIWLTKTDKWRKFKSDVSKGLDIKRNSVYMFYLWSHCCKCCHSGAGHRHSLIVVTLVLQILNIRKKFKKQAGQQIL